uniref:Variant surface glycoprotein 1905 n=1 Tax=Trypanosoma brucei TaxID=5691 RepID=M4SZM2_9TRYP
MVILETRLLPALILLTIGCHGSNEKAATHMTSPALAAPVLSEVAEQHSRALNGLASHSDNLQCRLAQAVAAALEATTGSIKKAALPIALVLAKNLRRATTEKLAFATKLLKAQTKLANLTGYQFGTAEFDSAKIPPINTQQTDADSIASGNGNIYIQPGKDAYGKEIHTTFDTLRQHSHQWTLPQNFEHIKVYQTAMQAKGATDQRPLIAKTASSGGNKCKHGNLEEDAADASGNLCIVSGPVTTRKTYDLKLD